MNYKRSLFAAIVLSFSGANLAAPAQPPAEAQVYRGQGQGYMQSSQGLSPGSAVSRMQTQATDANSLKSWFARYDQVRRQAQMTPVERGKADNLLSNGLAVFVPGEEKNQAQKLLRGLVAKYQVAVNEMKLLPLYPETEQLHRGYYQYFNDARALFNDYLRVQDNIMVKDERTGKSLMSELMQRKANLENLEHQVKDLDQNLRNQLGIQPYRY